MKNLPAKNDLNNYRLEAGFIKDEACTPQENAVYQNMIKEGKELPEGVYSYRFDGVETNKEFYTLNEALSYEEEMEYLALENNKNIRIIKNCVVFFTILTAIGIAASLISVLSLMA